MGYTKDALKGFGWLGMLRFVARGFSFLRIIILARLLTPLEFGLFEIAALVLAIVEIFSETGINLFIIQSKEKIDKFINTAWITSIGRGIFISIVIVLVASPISKFFNSPPSYQLINLIAIVPFIRGFINPSVVSFQKELNFSREFLYRSLVLFIEALVSVIFVYFLKSPMGIVLGLSVSALFEVLVSFVLAKPIPKFTFRISLFKEIVRKGKWVTLGGIYNYLYQNIDNAVVGKILGPSSLGIYNMAYNISLIPITEISDVVARVTLPVYIKISNEGERLKRAFFRSLILNLIIVMPLGIIFFLFPKELVVLVLSERWIEASEILRILALFGVIHSISYSMTTLMLSLNRQDLSTHVSMVNFLTLALTIIPFVNIYGIKGAAFSALLGALASLPFAVYFAIKLIRKLDDGKILIEEK